MMSKPLRLLIHGANGRMGQALQFEQAEALVEEISESVLRHPNALISLARLKTSDEYTYMHSVAVCALMIALARQLGLPDDDPRVNPNGGAIAIGHPLGMSGTRITGTAALELARIGGKRALATMCIGVGQGIAVALERV